VDRALRHTAGSIVAAVAAAGGLGAWPELVMWLGHSLASAEAATLDGALDTLYKIAEDSMDQVGDGGGGLVGLVAGCREDTAAAGDQGGAQQLSRVVGAGANSRL